MGRRQRSAFRLESTVTHGVLHTAHYGLLSKDRELYLVHFDKSAGQLGLATDVVHLSWGAGQWSLFVLLQTTPRGPWLAVHVRTLALKNGKVIRLIELSGSIRHYVN